VSSSLFIETGHQTPKSEMKAEDTYLKFVRWEADDNLYVGYCPDLFPWGGVCHGESEEDAFRTLCELVREEVDDLQKTGKPLPASVTRAMRDAILA
jgi:predicted RNase H-like HicB family nuclease